MTRTYPLASNLNTNTDKDLIEFCQLLNAKGIKDSQIIKLSVRLFMQLYDMSNINPTESFLTSESREKLFTILIEYVKGNNIDSTSSPSVSPKSKRKSKPKPNDIIINQEEDACLNAFILYQNMNKNS